LNHYNGREIYDLGEKKMIVSNHTKNNDIDLEEFIQIHGKALLHYIYSIMNHWELAEDIYQETLISAFIHYKSFEKRSSLKNWIYKIAQNKCKDEWKKDNVRNRYINNQASQKEEENLYNETENTVLEKCLHEELMKKINELPKRYKNPILLYYFQDFTILDISKKSEMPMSTVKTHLRRGKEKLKYKVATIN